jgi:hypothetical protein
MTDYGDGKLPVSVDPLAWNGRAVSYPLDAGTIQAAIAAQLVSIFAQFNLNIATYIWPDYDLDTWWASSAIAFVLVSYRGLDLSTPKSTDAMTQERKLKYELHVEARKVAWALNGPGSVYNLIDGIEQALGGFKPNGCRNAYFTDHKFSEQDSQGRVWLFDMTLNVTTMRQKMDPNYLLANLQQATFNIQPSGDVVVVT